MPFRLVFFTLVCLSLSCVAASARAADRPNILVAISDDQSWLHASAYGSKMVQTPHFDRIAKEGVLFTNAFAPSPGCSPSRASFLTGLMTWQLEHAGTHASYFDKRFTTFPERLAEAGYFVGYTGKGWGPGDFKQLGWEHNPAGPRFDHRDQTGKLSRYAASFAHFLSQRPADQPFCFWFGSTDPHRGYQKGSGLAKGKRLEDAEVPPFLPDRAEIRSDLLDYAFEIERFDSDLGQILELLAKSGELDNTLIIVTSDNGMPFPRAKANCYEYGIHMPLAVRWGAKARGGRRCDDLVGFTDLTATIYDVTGVAPPEHFQQTGLSLRPILLSDSEGIVMPDRTAVFSARERHSSSRYRSLGYPQRCIRTRQYLYIRNFKPERWPAGPGQKYERVVFDDRGRIVESELGPPHDGYHDIDGSPSLTYLIDHRDEPDVKRFFDLAVAHRPEEELYDVVADPGCLHNLSGESRFATVRKQLSERLLDYLKTTGDARVTGNGDVWETYPRVSSLRWFPEPQWAREHPEWVPEQPWLDARRPRK